MEQALVFRAQVYQEYRIEEARNDAIRAAALDLLTVWRVSATVEECRSKFVSTSSIATRSPMWPAAALNALTSSR